MEILRLDVELAEPIGRRPYETRLAAAAELLRGEGEAHAYLVRIGPGGEIGRHEAAFGQLFVALAGRGWVAGGDGRRVPLAEGEAALIRRGEPHAKGSDTGLTALMIQVRDLDRPA